MLYAEWRALGIRAYGDWETALRRLTPTARRRLAAGVRMPRTTMVAASSPFIKQCVEFARALEARPPPLRKEPSAESGLRRVEPASTLHADNAEPPADVEPEPQLASEGSDHGPEPEPEPLALDRHDDGRRSPDWLHRRATPKATQSDKEVADLSRTPGVPRSGVASSLGASRRATSVIVRPVARLGPDGHVGVLAHTNVELLNTVIKDKTGAEWSPGAHDKLRVQPLLAHYHSDGRPEQELSADNPEAIIRVIGLAELTASEAGLTLSDRRKADGSLQTLADTLQRDPAAVTSLTQGERAPVKIDWHDRQ